MIFIATGSRSFQFNRLLKAVDDAVEEGKITDEIFAQVGSSDYPIKHYAFTSFLNQDEFQKYLQKCDIILTHGGTGVIINAVKLGKRVIAVPRLAEYNEVIDNHQVQLIEEFENLNMVIPCYECTGEAIASAIEQAKSKKITQYVSNTEHFIKELRTAIMPQGTEDKKRILMCGSARSEKGGMNSVIDQLMNHDWEKDIELNYLATHISGNNMKKSCYFLRAFRNLKRLLKKNAFDLVHIHMSYKGSFYRKYMIAKACKKYKKKIVIHLHGSEFKDFYEKGSERQKKRIRELFTIADVTIVLGEEWKRFLTMIAPTANVVIVPNAVPLQQKRERLKNNNPQILFLGALIKRKGVHDLLESVRELRKQLQVEFKVFIAGSGVEEESLKQYVKKYGIEEYVEFLGWIGNKEKRRLFHDVDLFVLPSYNEGLPMAILEALSYGIPVVSTNVGSISDAVKDGIDGYLVAPGEMEQLTSAILQVLEDGECYKQLSEGAYKMVEEHFSEEKLFENIMKIYREL